MTLPTELYPQYLREKAVSWMIIVSVGFHLLVVGGAIVFPWLSSGSRSLEPVYTVELVDMLSKEPAPTVQGPPQKEVKASASPPQAQSKPVELPETAARIQTPNVKSEVAEPIPIVKSPQHLKIKVNEAQTEERIASQLDKLKREAEKQKKQEKREKQEKEEEQRLSSALESLRASEAEQQREEPKAASSPSTAAQGAAGTGIGGGLVGLKLQIYRTQVWNKVRSNWSYPEMLALKQNLEAVVLVSVTKDGRIQDSRLLKKSGNTLFDQSVLRAVKLSEPLPPFPEGYVMRMEELELRFSLSDLAGAS